MLKKLHYSISYKMQSVPVVVIKRYNDFSEKTWATQACDIYSGRCDWGMWNRIMCHIYKYRRFDSTIAYYFMYLLT